MNKPASILISLLVSLCALAAQPSGDWSRFRGPNGSGTAVADRLPVEFGPDKNVVWKTALPTGYSSPALFGDRIFLTGEEDEKLFTFCLDRRDGSILWKRTAPRERQEPLDRRNNPAAPTPVVDAQGVYVFFADFGLIAYDLEGNLRWKRPLGPFKNLYGMGASPILVAGAVVLVCDQQVDSFIIAVDAANGQVRWRTDRPEAISGHSTPVVYRPAQGEPQILVPGSFLLTAYSPRDGSKLWWVGGLSVEMKSTPAISGDMLYINGYATPLNQPDKLLQLPTAEEALTAGDADGDGRLSPDEVTDRTTKNFFSFIDLKSDGYLDRGDWDFYRAAMASKNGMLAIRLGGSGDMTERNLVWQYHRSVPQLPSPLLYKDILYMINDGGIATTFDPGDGTVKTRGRIRGAIDNYYASPVAGDGKIYLISETGKAVVLSSDGALTPLAVNDLDSRCYATPAIDKDRLYVRTWDTLYCFGTP